uniref:Uncharacterized protein n=1 Tax=Synechococcus elongatus (strain ATCC 33912 / PCC 7942 / FACHB-805) TaxID=1140 RepID=Q54768_SYNE7|nr:hypothetical protein [Synechococcus elongatus PCC 7942 = FACHB-805]
MAIPGLGKCGRLMANQAEEFLAGALILLENTDHGAGHGPRARLLDTAHHHAHVGGFHDDGHTLRVEDFLHRLSNLAGQALLHLQTATVHLDDASQFAQADNLLVGDVSDVNFAHERQHVVFTKAEGGDVTHQHHFVVTFVEDGAVDQVIQGLAVAAGQKAIGLSDPFRGFQEPFPLWIFSDPEQQRADCCFHLGLGNSLRLRADRINQAVAAIQGGRSHRHKKPQSN